MTLLAKLPASAEIDASFAPIIGDAAMSQGLAGAVAMIGRLDPSALEADISVRIGGDGRFSVSGDPSAGIAAAADGALSALDALPLNPASLLTPLKAAIDAAGTPGEFDLGAAFDAAASSLRDTLAASDLGRPRDLLGDIALPLDAVAAEFTVGSFATLREWGEQLDALREEIAAHLARPPVAAAEELSAFFAARLASLAETIAGPAISIKIDADLDLEGLTARFEELFLSLDAAMIQAAAAFAAGGPVNRAAINAAASAFAELDALAAELTLMLDRLLKALPNGARVEALLDDLITKAEDIEIIDLADLGSALKKPLARLDELLDKLELPDLAKPILSAFEKLEAALDALPVPDLSAALSGAIETLDVAIQQLTAVWTGIAMELSEKINAAADALRSALSPLGTFQPDGSFEPAFYGQVEAFYTSLSDALTQTVRPALTALADGLQDALGEAAGILEDVLAEIPALIDSFEAALAGAADDVRALDLEGRVGDIRDRLDAALDKLGTIDANVIIDPVIGELEDMAAALSELDFSAMGEATLGPLKLSAKVLVEIDFKAQIAETLIEEMNEVANAPRLALEAVQARIDEELAKLDVLAPDVLLKPLVGPLETTQATLSGLDISTVAAPVTAWKTQAVEALSEVSPGRLLSPVSDLHARLSGKVSGLSFDALTAEVEALVADASGSVPAVQLPGQASVLSDTLADIRGKVEALSADGLIAPLSDRHASLLAAVDTISADRLLAPFQALFEAIAAPLDALTDAQAALIGKSAGLIGNAIAMLDPTRFTDALRAPLAETTAALRTADVAGRLATLRTSHASLKAGFSASAGPADLDLEASITAMNPVAGAVGRLSARIREAEARLAELDRSLATVPAERAAALSEKLSRLVPGWARDDLPSAELAEAIRKADPLGLRPAIETMHARLRGKVEALDPTQIGDLVEQAKAPIYAKLDGLDPTEALAELSAVPTRLGEALGALDLDLLQEVTTPPLQVLDGVVGALDPAPLVAELDAQHAAVLAELDALDPEALLAPLNEVLVRVQEAALAIDLDAVKGPITAIHEEIAALVAALDITEVLSPLTDRIEDVRADLEDGLRRAEAAFNKLLGALPK